MGADFFGQALFAIALAGTVVAAWNFRRYLVFLLLWLPLPFYALSIAYGSVPIYLPVWYPFSYYNVRYGLELLPVFAVFPAILAGLVAERMSGKAGQAALWVTLIAIVATSYLSAYRETPITLREAK